LAGLGEEVDFRYVRQPFFRQLRDEKLYGHFQRHPASAHTDDHVCTPQPNSVFSEGMKVVVYGQFFRLYTVRLLVGIFRRESLTSCEDI
jgi:hypothetical protein